MTHASPAPGPHPASASFLLDRGLLTPDQVGELLLDSVRTGRTVEALALERGWLDEAALVAAAREQAAAPEPRPPLLGVAPSGHDAAPDEPASPQPQAAVEFAVSAVLANGTVVEIESHATHDAAWDRARALAGGLTGARDDEWLPLGASIVRPSAVLALDVRPRAPRR